MHLLDVSILIARVDEIHPAHSRTKQWMATNALGWATSPITENGLLRILGHPRYPGGGPGSPEGAALALRGMRHAIPGHQFFPDNISLLDSLPSLKGISSTQLTDVYLLTLAVNHGARFLTLDHRINASKVPGGAEMCDLL